MGLQTKAFEIADLLGWSMEDLAEKSGVPRSTLYAVRKGDRGVGPKVIAGLMRAFPQLPFERLFVSVKSTDVDSEGKGVDSAPVAEAVA